MTRACLWAVLALAIVVTPAKAALTLCNRTSYILYAATAIQHGAVHETRGWERLVPGDCTATRSEDLSGETILVHARSAPAYGAVRAWGGGVPLCVRDGNFTLKQIQAVCSAGSHALPFAAIDTQGKHNWTMTLDEASAYPTFTAAQLVGVKRLLAQNGYPVGTIDGKPSKATGAALKAFRDRMHFAPTAGNAELFAALESEAVKKSTSMQGR